MNELPRPLAVSSMSWKMEGLQEHIFRVARWAALTPLLLGPPGFALLSALSGSRGALSTLAAALGLSFCAAPVVGLIGAAVGLEWSVGKGKARLFDDALSVSQEGRDRLFSLDDFRAGWVNGKVVELETRHGNVLQLTMRSETEARELLAGAGLDARRRTMQMRLGPSDFLTTMLYLVGPMVAWWGAMAAGGALNRLVGPVPGELRLMAMSFLFVLFFVLLRGAVNTFLAPAGLTIGADGVKIEQNLSTTFLPFSSIVTWDIDEDGVSFATRDGRTVRARARHLRLDGKASAVYTRLQEARKVHLEGWAPEEARALLRRGGRPLADWRASLRGLLRPGDYRGAPLSEDDLVRVLESPDEPAEARVGAALALREQARGETQARLRVAAGACANPRLRVAFERIADEKEDDEVLAAALEGEAPRGRAQGG